MLFTVITNKIKVSLGFFKFKIVDERAFYESIDRKYSKEKTPVND